MIESPTEPGASAAPALAPPSPEHADTSTWSDELVRLGSGGAMAATYGLALGARDGVASMVQHALFVPLAPLAVCLVAGPAFMIVLALADAPIPPISLARAGARAAGQTGKILVGLAPCVGLFMTTAEEAASGALVGAVGLAASGLVGLYTLKTTMAEALEGATPAVGRQGRAATVLFILFATALATRIWSAALPVFAGGGAS
jgi:hypothetical protein